MIIEIAFSQLRGDALTEITTHMANDPGLLGAIVISVLESPCFENPKHKRMNSDVQAGLYL